MKKYFIFLTLLFSAFYSGNAMSNQDQNLSQKSRTKELATFAGGCFWCMEPPFEKLQGVISVTSGFSGGDEKNPSYEDVVRGKTGHRESVQIVYDPKQVKYETLLDIFWQNIDPTDDGGQFADRGDHYKTAIFYSTPEQKKVAIESQKKLEASGIFKEPLKVQLLPYKSFYPAEEYHQDYYKKNELHYKLYKKGSGREDFLEKTWKEKK